MVDRDDKDHRFNVTCCCGAPLGLFHLVQLAVQSGESSEESCCQCGAPHLFEWYPAPNGAPVLRYVPPPVPVATRGRLAKRVGTDE